MATTRETVYDRCAYVGCYNGKFINGRKLFHFPAETDRRLEMWIERSGNFRLRTWAATSLRKAGLCGDHFDDRSFTNATRKALRRNVVPRHYTEDFKYRQANRANQEISLEMARVGGIEETTSFDETLSLPDDFEGLKEVVYNKNDYKDVSKLSDQSNGTLEAIGMEEKSRSSSPLVEFIVEELDETLIPLKSPLSVNSSEGEAKENGEKREAEEEQEKKVGDEEEEEEEEEEERGNGAEEEGMSESVMGSETSNDEENSRVTRTSSDVIISIDFPGMENPAGEASDRKELVYAKDKMLQEKRSCCPYNDLCSNPAHEETLRSLRNENEQLRRKIRILKQNLVRSKAREANYTKVRTMLKSIDEFLDVQECTNPATRAMVKLSLHKPKSPYTKEEKEFAIQLYKDSVGTIVNLRKSGCHFPGESTMKRWITEEYSGKISDDPVITNKVDEVEAHNVIEAVHVDNNGVNYGSHPKGNSQNSLTLVHMETEIHYMPEAIDGLEQVLESPEVQQVQHLVDHFEARTEGERNDKMTFLEPVNARQETFS